jgi:hypothetical protein
MSPMLQAVVKRHIHDASLWRIVEFVLIGLLPTIGVGCVPIAYIVPKQHDFSVSDLNAPSDELRIFLQQETYSGRYCATKPGSLKVTQLKNPVNSSRFSYHALSWESALHLRRIVIEAWEDGWQTEHGFAIKLHRPGYQTVTLLDKENAKLMGNEKIEKVAWKPTHTLYEQEFAVDEILLFEWVGNTARSSIGYDRPTYTSGTQTRDFPDSFAGVSTPRAERRIYYASTEPFRAPTAESDADRTWPNTEWREQSVLEFAIGEYSRIASVFASTPATQIIYTDEDGHPLDPEQIRRESLQRLHAKIQWVKKQL